jgi:hypothetical protein
MKQIQFNEFSEQPQHLCSRCGSLMRLVGSEPHLADRDMDLLTYSCTTCDDYLVVPTKIARPRSDSTISVANVPERH